MIALFQENPLLLLFIVAALGYGVGSVRIGGTKLGVAAVLFVGLGFGALDKELRISETVIFLGLSIFVYTIALQSGHTFFTNLKNRGLKDIGFVLCMLLFSGLASVGAYFILDLDVATTAGLFSGVTTSTPALAGLIDLINNKSVGVPTGDLAQHAVVGYSLGYPMGVLGVMLAIKLTERFFRVNYKEEAEALSDRYLYQKPLTNTTIRVTRSEVVGQSLRDLTQTYRWKVIFGRMRSETITLLPNWDTTLHEGDVLTIVGSKAEGANVAQVLGEVVKEQLTDDRSVYDVRRMFVSNPKVAGEKLASLNIPEQYSALVTRVLRGDMDLLASGDTTLELGDQVRLVARRQDIPALRKLFGDSYEALSHINLLSFGMGMAIGLLLGMITFQLTDDLGFRLGFAGGPLLVGLILGYLRRTGPIVWTLSYSTNLTLRQFGLILLLAGVGINSGHTFLSTIQTGNSAMIFLAGTIISLGTAITTLFVGYKILRIPFTLLLGMVSSQPAILDFATDQTGNKLPAMGFTVMLPIALIAKIVFVQLLYLFLGGS